MGALRLRFDRASRSPGRSDSRGRLRCFARPGVATRAGADLPSLLLLAFLARALADVPVLVVSTHHDAGPSRGPEVEGIFGELSRFGRRIDLGGLEDDDLRRLVAHRTGADPSDDLVRRLAAVTEGNPFFSDEVVRLLVSHGPARPGDRLPLPDGVRDAIRRRLQPLSPRRARRSRSPPSRAAASASRRSSARPGSRGPRCSSASTRRSSCTSSPRRRARRGRSASPTA